MALRRYTTLLTLLLCALVSLQQVAPARRGAVGRGTMGRSALPIPLAFEEELAEEGAAVLSRTQQLVRVARARSRSTSPSSRVWVLRPPVDASWLEIGDRRRKAELPRRQHPPDEHSRRA